MPGETASGRADRQAWSEGDTPSASEGGCHEIGIGTPGRDVVLINKVGTAQAGQVATIEASVRELNPYATVIRANSVVTLTQPKDVTGKRVLVVEDGPTLMHDGMKFGAGVVAARQAGAAEIVDPRPYVTGTMAEIFRKYDFGPVLPAEGYSTEQLGEREQAIAATPCDTVVVATAGGSAAHHPADEAGRPRHV